MPDSTEFTRLTEKIDANITRGEEISREVRANIEQAQELLARVRLSPWPWQRPANRRLLEEVRALSAVNKRLQSEAGFLIQLNTLLLTQLNMH